MKQDIQIVPYAPLYKDAFIALNKAWISKYFQLEPNDREAFEHPDTLVTGGGAILFALVDGQVKGTCALKNHGSGNYELCKFAVDPQSQGLGLGNLLINAIVEKAKALHANRLFLEGNTKLKASIHLYTKAGFVAIPHTKSSYERVDIVMEKNL